MKGAITTLLLIMQLTGLSRVIPTGGLEKAVLPSSMVEIKPRQSLDILTSSRPQAVATNPVFSLKAASVYALDRESGVVLYSQNAGQERPIASITKLMSLLVLLRGHQPAESITIKSLPSYNPEDAKLGLINGQQFSFSDLLAAMLIKSANDSADALAIHDSGSLEAFTVKMNSLLNEWGIEHSHFAAPSGLVDNNNFSTAESLAKIAALALSNSSVRELVNTESKVIHDTSGKPYSLETTNLLLKDNRFHGIKTGYTLAAGQSVVALASIKGHDVITVVLGSPDRFGETTQLVNYLEGAYTWQ